LTPEISRGFKHTYTISAGASGAQQVLWKLQHRAVDQTPDKEGIWAAAQYQGRVGGRVLGSELLMARVPPTVSGDHHGHPGELTSKLAMERSGLSRLST